MSAERDGGGEEEDKDDIFHISHLCDWEWEVVDNRCGQFVILVISDFYIIIYIVFAFCTMLFSIEVFYMETIHLVYPRISFFLCIYINFGLLPKTDQSLK